MLIPVFVASAAGSAAPIVGLAGASLIRKNFRRDRAGLETYRVPAGKRSRRGAYWTE